MPMPGQRKSQRSKPRQVQMQVKKVLSSDQLLTIKALTKNQERVVQAWGNNMNLVLHGYSRREERCIRDPL